MKLECGHCNTNQPVETYAPHVKACVADKIAGWDEVEYSKRYHHQAKAQSRYRQPGEKKRRSQFKSWGWWLMPDGPPLSTAEVPAEVIREHDRGR